MLIVLDQVEVGRREVGVIVGDTAIAKRLQEVFEADWQKTLSKAEAKVAAENLKGEKAEKVEVERV